MIKTLVHKFYHNILHLLSLVFSLSFLHHPYIITIPFHIDNNDLICKYFIWYCCAYNVNAKDYQKNAVDYLIIKTRKQSGIVLSKNIWKLLFENFLRFKRNNLLTNTSDIICLHFLMNEYAGASTLFIDFSF